MRQGTGNTAVPSSHDIVILTWLKRLGAGAARDSIQGYLMLLPMLIGFALFTIYPILWLVRYAWFDYDGLSEAQYIGIENFIRAFNRDPEFWMSLLNTFIITFVKLLIELPLALILAVFLNAGRKINSVYRTAFFMPTIVSTAIVGLVFCIIFDPYQGIVNVLFKEAGLMNSATEWFSNKWTAMLVIVVASVWNGFGINMVFFLMGLQSVPKELYECADIDGATRGQQFFHITIPMLAPVMQVVIMLAILSSMKMADLVLVLTNGQPGGQTEVVMTFIFKRFFNFGVDTSSQYGYGAALAVITAVIFGIITALYTRITRGMSRIH